MAKLFASNALRRPRWGALSLLWLAAACSSTKITFRSTPESAQVFVKPLGTGSLKPIGLTPITVDARMISVDGGGAGPINVIIRKPGYTDVRVLVTEVSSIDLTLNVELELLSTLSDPLKMNASVDRLFEAQSLIRKGRRAEALRLLSDLKAKAPTLSAAYELEGGIRFLNKDYDLAFEAFKQAVALNPDSPQALRMREILAKRILRGTQATIAPDVAPNDNGAERVPAAEPTTGAPNKTQNSSADDLRSLESELGGTP